MTPSLRQNAIVADNQHKPTTVSIEMPVFCFDVIISKLEKKHPMPGVPMTIPDKNFPIFVTWKKGHSRHLRGCIGTFSRFISLHESLIEYAQTSAFHDTRFDPVSIHEIPHLHCSVSLLVHFEPANHYKDWEIGVHGIRIDFKDHSNRRLSAVYLPEVASEQGWSHIETMDNLMRKGGFRGEISENDRLAVTIERFQSEKTTISYEEYRAFKRACKQDPGLNDHQPSGTSGGTGGTFENLRNGFFHSCLP